MLSDSISQEASSGFVLTNWLVIALSVFSGIGAGFILHILSLNREKIKEKSKNRQRRYEVLNVISDEISDNIRKMETMIENKEFRPYWVLSTLTFKSIVSELPKHFIDDSDMLSSLYNRYRQYDLINRQLDLLHYRNEGLKASIYSDSTMPLLQQELPKSKMIYKVLEKAKNAIIKNGGYSGRANSILKSIFPKLPQGHLDDDYKATCGDISADGPGRSE